MKETLVRTLTAMVILPIIFVCIKFLPSVLFSLVLYLIFSIVAYEFIKLCKPKTFSLLLIFIFGLIIASHFTFNQPDLLMSIMGIVFGFGLFFLFSIRKSEELSAFIRDIGIHFLTVFYIYIPLYFIFKLRELGANYLFFLIFVILIGDSGAYFIGRWVGKHSIYPVASPKKTLEGLIAAILTAAPAGWLARLIFPIEVEIWKAILTGGLIALFSQLSDPIESLFKRAANQKDSGAILPGHGGFLDRLDSYIFCSPLLYYLILFFWNA